jgi:hypothetical protein
MLIGEARRIAANIAKQQLGCGSSPRLVAELYRRVLAPASTLLAASLVSGAKTEFGSWLPPRRWLLRTEHSEIYLVSVIQRWPTGPPNL